jgi:hypothetical protein
LKPFYIQWKRLNLGDYNRKKRLRLPLHFHFLSPSVTNATQQLTQALQELNTRNQAAQHKPIAFVSQVISADRLHFSEEVAAFLDEKQQCAEKARKVSVGSY